MRYEWLVGRRYTRPKRSSQFVAFLSVISMAGVALGVAALIVVLSVVNGFEHEFRKGVLGATPHVQVVGFGGALRNWESAAATAEAVPGVRATAPFVQAQVLLSAGGNVRGSIIRGIDPARERRAVDLDRQMKSGRLDDLASGSLRIILGSELAKGLGVKVGERVVLIAPRGDGGSDARLPLMKPAVVAGTFGVGMYDFDNMLALMHIDDLRTLYAMGQRVSGLRVQLDDPMQSTRVAAELGQRLPDYFVSEWTRGNANLFFAVQTSKRMVVLVVSLLIAIATFNIVASLVMAVTEKAPAIAILRTLGASPGGIMRIFMVQGAMIGLIGTAIGVLAGVAIAWNVPSLALWVEHAFGFKAISAEVYRIDQLPSRLQWGDVVYTAAVALLLSLAATVYPSWRAARLDPAAALRYE
ncbi:MAG: lipoprotein-releasing ABC transporter permease subunit [Betaproteobacteria bacterium]|nr:lipoprotein-releasing ABC transporter permease subunit [Betaproteobacteria bacterium]